MTELLDADLLLNYDDALARIEELRVTLEDSLSSAADTGTAALAEDFKDAFAGLADGAATPIDDVRALLEAALGDAAGTGAAALGDALSGVGEGVSADLAGAISDAAETGASTLAGSLADASTSGGDDLTTALGDAADAGGQAVTEALSTAADTAQGDLTTALTQAAADGGDAMTTSFADASSTVRDDLTNAITEAADTGAAALGTALTDATDSVGPNLSDSLTSAVDDAASTGASTLGDALETAFVTAALVGGGAIAEELGPHLDSTITAMGDAIVAAIQEAAQIGGADLSDALTQAADEGGAALSDSLSSAGTGGLADSIGQVTQATQGANAGLGDMVDHTALLGGATALATGNVGGLKEAAGGLGLTSITGAAGVLTLVEGTHKLIEAGVEGLSATQRFDAILGSFGDQVKHVQVGNLSDDLDHLSISLGTVPSKMEQTAANIFQLGVNAGLTKPQVANVTDEIIALASRAVALKPSLGDVGDVANRMALQLGRGGIRVQQYGVQLTAAQITAEALRETHKNLTSDLTPFEKTVAGVTLATQRYGGTLKEDIAKGTQNAEIQQRSFNATIQDFLEKVGKPLVIPFFQIIREGIPAVEALAQILGTLAQAALPAVQLAVKLLVPVLEGFNFVIQQIPGPVLAVVDAFLAFKALQFIKGVLDGIRTSFKSLAADGGAAAASTTAANETIGATATQAGAETAAAATVIVTSDETMAGATTGAAADMDIAFGTVGGSAEGAAAGVDLAAADIVAADEAMAAATEAAAAQMTLALGEVEVASGQLSFGFLAGAAAEAGPEIAGLGLAGEEAATGLGAAGASMGVLALSAAAIVLPAVGVLALLGAFGETGAQQALDQIDESMKRIPADSDALSRSLFANVQDSKGFADALDLMNKKLSDFVTTQSRFKSSNQLDDLKRIGLSAHDVANELGNGNAGLAKFFDTATAHHEVSSNLARSLATVESQSGRTRLSVDELTKAAAGNRKELNLLREQNRSGDPGIALLKKQLDDLGVGTHITGDEFANLTLKQQNNVIAALETSGSNADLITSFRDLQRSLEDSEKATFQQVVTQDNLPKSIQKSIVAQATLKDGTIDYTQAAHNAAAAAQFLGSTFESQVPNADVLTQSFTDLNSAVTAAEKNLPGLGATLDKLLSVQGVSTQFGIDPKAVPQITQGLEDEAKAVEGFFSNIKVIVDQGNPALAAALTQLGPDNLGARSAAILAANQPKIAEGWNTALQGLEKGEIVAKTILDFQKDRTGFLVKALGNNLAEQFAQSKFGTDIADLTDQQLEQVANHFKNNPQIGPAAQTFLATALAQFTLHEKDFGVSAQRASSQFDENLKIRDAVQRRIGEITADTQTPEQLGKQYGLHFGKGFGESVAGDPVPKQTVNQRIGEIAEDTSTPEKVGKTHGLHFGTAFAEGLRQDNGIAAATARIGELVLDGLPAETLGRIKGLHFGTAFAAGIEAATGETTRTSKRIGEIAQENLTPEQAGLTRGLHFGAQFAAGIEAATGETTKASRKIGELAEDGLPAEKIGHDHGLHFGAQFAKGILDSAPDTTAASKRIGQIAQDNIDLALAPEAHGLHFGKQFAAGIETSAPDAKTGTEAVSQAVLDALPTDEIGRQYGLHFGKGFGDGVVIGVPADAGSKAANKVTTGMGDRNAQNSAKFAGIAIGAIMAQGIAAIDFQAVGSRAGFDFAVGVIKQQNHVRDVGHAIGAIMEAGVKLGLQSQSPSKVMLALGAGAVDGFVLGVEGQFGAVDNTAHDLAALVTASFADAIVVPEGTGARLEGSALAAFPSPETAHDAGTRFGESFGDGVDEAAPHVDEAAKRLSVIMRIIDPTTTGLAPERMRELGRNAVASYADGIVAATEQVSRVAQRVVDGTTAVFAAAHITPTDATTTRSADPLAQSLLGQVLPPGVHIEHLHVENVSPDPVVQGFEASRQLAAAVYRGGR